MFDNKNCLVILKTFKFKLKPFKATTCYLTANDGTIKYLAGARASVDANGI